MLAEELLHEELAGDVGREGVDVGAQGREAGREAGREDDCRADGHIGDWRWRRISGGRRGSLQREEGEDAGDGEGHHVDSRANAAPRGGRRVGTSVGGERGPARGPVGLTDGADEGDVVEEVGVGDDATGDGDAPGLHPEVGGAAVDGVGEDGGDGGPGVAGAVVSVESCRCRSGQRGSQNCRYGQQRRVVRCRARPPWTSGTVLAMETLIVWSPTTPLPALERLLGTAAAGQFAEAIFDDVLATAARWRETRIAADFNRRLVVVAPTSDHGRLGPRVEAVGGRLEHIRGEGDDAIALAFADEFDRGARAVALLGLAAPTVSSHHLDHAFRALQFERLVVGPAFDGGTWLVGAQRPAPASMVALAPGRPGTLMAYEQALREAGDVIHLLPFWYTVDGDVERLAWHLRQSALARTPLAPRTRDALLRLPAPATPRS